MQEEAAMNGESDLEDARDLFRAMQEEFFSLSEMSSEYDGEHDDSIENETGDDEECPHSDSLLEAGLPPPIGTEKSPGGIISNADIFEHEQKNQNSLLYASTKSADGPKESARNGTEPNLQTRLLVQDMNTNSSTSTISPIGLKDLAEDAGGSLRPADDNLEQAEIMELSEILPGLPLTRIKRIRTEFKKTLSHPSFLSLIPILRERMPDHLTSGWLKRMNTANAEVVLEKAANDGIVDVHLLNAMLEVKTRAASIDRALQFYEGQFSKHGLVSF